MFSSYAFNNTLFAFGQNHEKLRNILQSTRNSMFEWYQETTLILYFNPNVSDHVTTLWSKGLKPVQINVIYFWDYFLIKKLLIANQNGNFEGLLGVVIDREFTFAKYIENLCPKINKKLQALASVTKFVTLEKHLQVTETLVFS